MCSGYKSLFPTMDINTDYIDNNYAWQQRIQTVFKNCKTSVPFPYAAAIAVEFNPVFERHEKINVELLTNGAILDINDFVKSATKSASFHLLDILIFNFDLGLDADSLLYYTYASKVYSLAKTFKDQFKARPLQLHAKLPDVFPLPDPSLENTDLLLRKSDQKMSFVPQLNDERKGDPIVINKFAGRTVQLSMDYYPLCKKVGVTFVLQPSKKPAQKLSTSLLTGGMMLEMLDFARILSGSYPQMLKEVISHNFGEVYEPCYLTGQVKALFEKRTSQPTKELRESLCKEPFKFMLRKVKRPEKTQKRPCNLNSDVELVPEKRSLDMPHSSTDYVWLDKEINEASYMCPVEFETDLQTNTGPENEKNEDVLVDIELAVPETIPMREKLQEEYVPREKTQTPRYIGFQYIRKRRNIPAVSISEIFSEDTLPMHQKTAKQKEWTRRSNRIKDIFNKGIQDLFCRCCEIGLDFNVGSGRKQNLDMNLLTNLTLYEVNRFSVHLSKSVSVFLMDIMESNFTLGFQDEPHERNFMSYLLGKERPLYNQAHNETFLNALITFPEGYNVVDLTREYDDIGQSDDVLGEDISEDFPYSKDINLNLWSLDGRPPDRKLDLTAMTNGALLEIITFTRRLASNPRDLFNDVLEHNFDVDLQDPATEDTQGLNKWFAANKLLLKKPLSALKANKWLTEEVSLKQYLLPKHHFISEIVTPIPVQKAQEYKYEICEEIGLELNVSRKSPSKQKLDLRLLTRGALFEVHNFVKTKCNRYVPALYEILDYNFDFSSQRHRKVELAWSIATQVLAMVRKGKRRGQYMRQVFELPFESTGEVCKEEPEERETEETDPGGDDVVFVRKLIPVDIDVEIE